MEAIQLIRIGSVTNKYNKQGKETKAGVLDALRHNKRTMPPTSNINVTRTYLNYCIEGDDTPENIAKHANVQMAKAGIAKTRKNGVMAVEIVFSLPNDRHNQDTRSFFTDCYSWLSKHFDGELLAFDVHLDESQPHAHALILPLIDGKMQGDKLKGDRKRIKDLQNMFHSEVAGHYGLSKSNGIRLTSTDKQSIERQVLNCLNDDPSMKSSVWACIRDAIHDDPMPFAQMLSIEPVKPTSKTSKSFVDHKRSKGKGSFVT